MIKETAADSHGHWARDLWW